MERERPTFLVAKETQAEEMRRCIAQPFNVLLASFVPIRRRPAFWYIRLKGPKRPIVPVDERREMPLALEPVDQVIIFYEDTPLNLIEALRPHVLVKGPDYANRECCGSTLVESYGGRVVIPVWPVQHSSTQLVDRIVSEGVAR